MFENTIQLAGAVEEIGVDTVWLLEHHGFRNGLDLLRCAYPTYSLGKVRQLRVGFVEPRPLVAILVFCDHYLCHQLVSTLIAPVPSIRTRCPAYVNWVSSVDEFRATDWVSESNASGSIASYKGGNWVTGWSVTDATRLTTFIEIGISMVLLLLTIPRSWLRWNEAKSLRRVS